MLAVAMPASRAGAVVRIGDDEGAGPDAGAAVLVVGDRRSNHIHILVTQRTLKDDGGSLTKVTFRITDARDRMRVGKYARLFAHCHLRGRHAVVCADTGTTDGTVRLGPGNDKLFVTMHGIDRQPAGSLDAFPERNGPFGEFLGWLISGGTGRDRIEGTPEADFMDGGPGADVLDGKGGSDSFTVDSRSGADVIRGGPGEDAVRWTSSAGARIDLAAGTAPGGARLSSIEMAEGGAGDDTLIGGPNAERLGGDGGADTITAGAGNDVVVGDGFFGLGTPGADVIDAGPGDDLIDLSSTLPGLYPQFPIGYDTPGPPDTLTCGEGNDAVDTFATQVVPADCEATRFALTKGTIPLRPPRNPDGSLSFPIPCPGPATGPEVKSCEGTVTLTRTSDGTVLGSGTYSTPGNTTQTVTIRPSSPVAAGETISVAIQGTFDGSSEEAYHQGWTTAF